MERRYESALLKPRIPDIKSLLSAEAQGILMNQYPNFADIHTRHDMSQIHNILHNEILLFKQDANAIVKEMSTVKEKLIDRLK